MGSGASVRPPRARSPPARILGHRLQLCPRTWRRALPRPHPHPRDSQGPHTVPFSPSEARRRFSRKWERPQGFLPSGVPQLSEWAPSQPPAAGWHSQQEGEVQAEPRAGGGRTGKTGEWMSPRSHGTVSRAPCARAGGRQAEGGPVLPLQEAGRSSSPPGPHPASARGHQSVPWTPVGPREFTLLCSFPVQAFTLS